MLAVEKLWTELNPAVRDVEILNRVLILVPRLRPGNTVAREAPASPRPQCRACASYCVLILQPDHLAHKQRPSRCRSGNKSCSQRRSYGLNSIQPPGMSRFSTEFNSCSQAPAWEHRCSRSSSFASSPMQSMPQLLRAFFYNLTTWHTSNGPAVAGAAIGLARSGEVMD